MGRLNHWTRVLMVGLGIATLPAHAGGGTIVKLQGNVTIERDGATVPASEGLTLREGDAIDVGETGKVQLRLEDDSLFALPGNSRLKLDTLQMPTTSERGSVVLSLLRGGFRTVTGLIGKMKGDTYRVNTAMATIGVRGSSYSSLMCDGACSASTRFAAGIYVKAHDGQIFVRNAGGQLSLRAGQTAFAASLNQAPVLVKSSPLDNPEFAIELDASFGFEFEAHPPRIEPEPPTSPS